MTEVKNYSSEYYKKLGSNIEHGFDDQWRKQFFDSFHDCGNVVLETLAQFALCKMKAVQHRLSGNIDSAMSAEAGAEYQYRKLPADCRW
jgi:hypothetical protein